LEKEKGMKPGLRAFLLTTLPLLLLFSAALVMADETTANLQSKVIASFDDPDAIQWIVQGSKFATKDFPEATTVRAWPDSLYGRNPEQKNLFALGIHGRFDRKGYNYIEIIPAKKGSDGKLAPSPLALPGRVKELAVWVWGSNFNYTMDVHLRDFEGVDRVLHLGSLNFAGWKNLTVTITGNIPQSRRYIPRFQGLDLTKLVIWTTPTEKVDDYYVFLDEVKVLTDLFETRFDGDNLADPKLLNQLWAQGTK
jgi:hypothetical protein